MHLEEVPFGKFGFVKRQTIDWFLLHRGAAISAFCLIFCGLIFSSRIIYWARGGSQGDYVAAENAYNAWKGNQETLAKLERILARHPELHAKYDGVIAQTLLGSSEKGLAETYATANVKRMEGFAPYYSSFARVTLMIAEGKHKDALQQAKDLKQQMAADLSFWEKPSKVAKHGALLYGYNLLRIAMLERAAGSPEEELAAWLELKTQAGWHGVPSQSEMYDSEAYFLMQKNFQKQNISLIDYINHREELLRRPKPAE
jgi:hypothetical protein